MQKIFNLLYKEQDSQGHMVIALTYIWTFTTLIIFLFLLFFFPGPWVRASVFIVCSLSIAGVSLTLNKLGYVTTASWALIILQWLFFTGACYTSGGIMAPGIIIQMSIILSAGILLGWRVALLIGLLSMGADFFLAYLETIGSLPEPAVIHTPISRWLAYFIAFGTTLALQYYATNHLRNGIDALKSEILRRIEMEKLKDETVIKLKERVKELNALYSVNKLLQDEISNPEMIFQKIVEIIPSGLQYPDIAQARIIINNSSFVSCTFISPEQILTSEIKTRKGDSTLSIEISYKTHVTDADEGPFLKEERDMIDMLVEMLKIYFDRKENISQLEDYKYALDIASLVAAVDVNGNYIFANQNLCNVSQYSLQELLGRPFTFLDIEDKSEEDLQVLASKLTDGNPYRAEVCNQAKDGSLFWVDRTIIPFLDSNGEVYQYLSINQNITQHKENVEKLREGEQLLKKITSQVHGNTYMFTINKKGIWKMLFINRGVDDINHTVDLQDLEAASTDLVEMIHEDDKQLWIDKMKEGFESEAQVSFQYRIWFNGVMRWRWFRAKPEKNKDGNLIWFGAAQDITPLVDYIASTEQIIFDISHVIRRPIASLLGITTLIIENDLNEEELKELIKSLKLTAQEMDEFLHELNAVYHRKRQSTTLNIDISALIDKRTSLFGN